MREALIIERLLRLRRKSLTMLGKMIGWGMSLRIFVHGPVGEGLEGVRKAFTYGEQIRALGMFPYFAHLNTLWAGIQNPTVRDQRFWSAQDQEWASLCHAVFCFGDVVFTPAGRHVFRDLGTLEAWGKREEARLRDVGLWPLPQNRGPIVQEVKGQMLLSGCPGHDPVSRRNEGSD